ncbi:type II toxin-antitoxin system Phd/YefM family antitoxin [Levilactobacillus wangkuiensis]|uniref:type II toxin-antitoxin system Phd/YefM family antitoxin n=1 Tax=Levilactobacillus wangkuiensis TaxID=2799566 RepID=UPI001942E0AD|nr:type II toxin-antitoxin system Phd/YefM family antitoxin [Levilactobacillus wangkuiensis]
MAMATINITDARKNLESLTDDIVDSQDYVIVTKPHNRNVVIMSEDEFNSWQETLYLLESLANHRALDASIDQMLAGNTKTSSQSEWQNTQS